MRKTLHPIQRLYESRKRFTMEADRSYNRVNIGIGLSARQLWVMRDLHMHPFQSVYGLAFNHEVTRQSMHQLVGKLIEMGLVTTSDDQDDRRLKRVSLTKVGVEVLKQTDHRGSLACEFFAQSCRMTDLFEPAREAMDAWSGRQRYLRVNGYPGLDEKLKRGSKS